MKKIKYIIHDQGSINIFIGKTLHCISPGHVFYRQILDCLLKSDIDSVETYLAGAAFAVQEISEKLVLDRGEVFYGGEVIHNSLTEKIKNFITEDHPYKPLVKFLENLMLNPNKRIVLELDQYIERGGFAITGSGCFLAYKRVRKDMHDYHTGTFDNTPGKTVKMKREDVDGNSKVTCSRGLHVCSKEYLREFNPNDGVVVLVEVNPKDVVSIPDDYNHTKIRCCEYKVIKVVDNEYEKKNKELLTEHVYRVKRGDIKKMKKTTPRRGPDGRFIKKTTPRRGPDGRFIKKTK